MADSSKISIFITGSTGYIGGAVLTRLLHHPRAADFSITALVRTPEKAAIIEKFGVKPLLGSHADVDKLAQAASEADVVITAADVDDLQAAKAILQGMKLYHEKRGKVPILIHTSGTGVLVDRAAGLVEGHNIYDDSNPDQIETLPPTAPHRPVDLEVVAADNAGYIKSHIILPSSIYALATGPLVDAGYQNPHSVQIPALIKASILRGQGGMVGLGKNIWPNVHIDDVADLYIVLLDGILAGKPIGHGRDGYYFGENGSHKMYDAGKAVAEALVALGKGQQPEPTTFTEEEVKKYFGGPWLGTNSRCVANHSRSVGWKPMKTTQDLLASIRPEVEAILEKGPDALRSWIM